MPFLSSGVLRLVVAGSVVAAAWLVALPWIARQPAEQSRWQTLQAAGVDPSAMYYSELDAMRPILERLNVSERRKTSSSLP